MKAIFWPPRGGGRPSNKPVATCPVDGVGDLYMRHDLDNQPVLVCVECGSVWPPQQWAKLGRLLFAGER